MPAQQGLGSDEPAGSSWAGERCRDRAEQAPVVFGQLGSAVLYRRSTMILRSLEPPARPASRANDASNRYRMRFMGSLGFSALCVVSAPTEFRTPTGHRRTRQTQTPESTGTSGLDGHLGQISVIS